jgi:tetratricopeptide (TPR) repeat protein
MANESLKTQIAQAWRYQREGRADAAVAEFERILKMDTTNVDANYGMALAQRALKRTDEAIKYFRLALELVQKNAPASSGPVNAGERRRANTPEDDRYMMLVRMINQRLAELNG